MSNSDFDEALADELGITIEELESLDYEVLPHESSDGILYGYDVYFTKGTDQTTLTKIKGLINGEWVPVGPIDTDEGAEPDM